VNSRQFQMFPIRTKIQRLDLSLLKGKQINCRSGTEEHSALEPEYKMRVSELRSDKASSESTTFGEATYAIKRAMSYG
jgi:hypothetical protein